ncbi:MAG: exosortase/archaeosortase family protein [Candidatus Bathyarchaeia archaeon]|jgi:exosortase
MQKPKISTAEMASTLNQQRLSIAIKSAAIAIAVVALYFQDLSMVFKGVLTDESTTFQILAIPFLFAYLLYRKRKMINAALPSPQTSTRGFQKYLSALAGIVLSAVAVLTYWYGSYTFTPIEYHMLTLPFLAAGLTLILFNLQTLKQLIVPIAFLIFLTPPPDQIFYSAGSTLANLCASASNALANVFGMHAALSNSSGSLVITLTRPDHTTLPFGVDVACSGVYSLIGFLIFALFIAYVMRGKLRNKFAVLIMGIPLIVALNIIRITTILAIGYNFGENLALQSFHYVGATVLLFLGTLLLLAITDKAFKKPKPPQPCPTCNPPPTNPTEPFCANCGKLFKHPKTKLNKADIAKIAGIAIIVVMLLSIQAPVFALTQGPAQVIIQTPSGVQVNTSNSMLPNVPGYTLNYLYRDTQFEQESGDDAALVYSYSSPNDTSSSVLAAIQIATSVSSEHPWEVCLITWPLSQGDQATVNQLDLRDIQIQDNPPMTARYFAFQYTDTNQTQVVLYWYETATFNTNGTAQTKSVMISLIMYPSSPQDVSQAEAQELPVANAINNYWQPIQTWSTVALSISQNGLALSASATAILVLLILYAVYLDRKEKLSLLNLYRKLPSQDQLIIKAVTNAKNNPTTQAITFEFQKLSKTPTSETWIAQKLNEAENAGTIKKVLINKDDNPALAWKNQIPEKNSLIKRLKI